MTITDKQIEAAAKEWIERNGISWDAIEGDFRTYALQDARAALEAAEAAAWCDDIGEAHEKGRRILLQIGENPATCYVAWWIGGSLWCLDGHQYENPSIKRWRHLPQPVKDKAS